MTYQPATMIHTVPVTVAKSNQSQSSVWRRRKADTTPNIRGELRSYQFARATTPRALLRLRESREGRSAAARGGRPYRQSPSEGTLTDAAQLTKAGVGDESYSGRFQPMPLTPDFVIPRRV